MVVEEKRPTLRRAMTPFLESQKSPSPGLMTTADLKSQCDAMAMTVVGVVMTGEVVVTVVAVVIAVVEEVIAAEDVAVVVAEVAAAVVIIGEIEVTIVTETTAAEDVVVEVVATLTTVDAADVDEVTAVDVMTAEAVVADAHWNREIMMSLGRHQIVGRLAVTLLEVASRRNQQRLLPGQRAMHLRQHGVRRIVELEMHLHQRGVLRLLVETLLRLPGVLRPAAVLHEVVEALDLPETNHQVAHGANEVVVDEHQTLEIEHQVMAVAAELHVVAVENELREVPEEIEEAEHQEAAVSLREEIEHHEVTEHHEGTELHEAIELHEATEWTLHHHETEVDLVHLHVVAVVVDLGLHHQIDPAAVVLDHPMIHLVHHHEIKVEEGLDRPMHLAPHREVEAVAEDLDHLVEILAVEEVQMQSQVGARHLLAAEANHRTNQALGARPAAVINRQAAADSAETDHLRRGLMDGEVQKAKRKIHHMHLKATRQLLAIDHLEVIIVVDNSLQERNAVLSSIIYSQSMIE